MSKPRKINSDTAHRWAHKIGDYSEIKILGQHDVVLDAINEAALHGET